MDNASTRPILILTLLLALCLQVIGCQVPPSAKLAASYVVALDVPPSQSLLIRASFRGLTPGPIDLLAPWENRGPHGPSVEWLQVKAGATPQATGGEEAPTTRWSVEVPAEGRLEISYRLTLGEEDGIVPSEMAALYGLLRSRSLFILPAPWFSQGRASPAKISPAVQVQVPPDWAVYSPWPFDPETATYHPTDLRELLSSALAIGGYLGYEVPDGALHISILMPRRFDLDYVQKRAAELGRLLDLGYRIFGYPPNLAAKSELWVLVASNGDAGAPSRAEVLSERLLLVRTDPDLTTLADGAFLRDALALWQGLAIRSVAGDDLSPAPQSCLARGWNEYLAQRLLLEAGQMTPVAYWQAMRILAERVHDRPPSQGISLAEAGLRALADGETERYLCAKGHLVALLLDGLAPDRPVTEGYVAATLRRLGQTHNYLASGATVTVEDLLAALEEEAGPEVAARARALFQEPGNLDLSSILQFAGPPIGETQTLVTPDGVRLYYQWLDGPSERAAIYLHGGPGWTPYDWLNGLAASLAPWGDVAYLEQRGSGRSDRMGPHRYSLDAYVNDVEVLREHLGVERVTLIGHAWGGFLALLYAQRYPDHVDALLLLAPIPSYPRTVRYALKDLAQARLADRHQVQQILGKDYLTYDDWLMARDILTASGAFGSDLGLVQQVQQEAYGRLVQVALLPADIPLYNKEILPTLILRDHLLQMDPMDRLTPGGYPVLILRGERDRVATSALMQELRPKLGAELREIPAAGHYLYLDAPAAVVSEIGAFLQAHPR